jgi:hypothetical protein
MTRKVNQVLLTQWRQRLERQPASGLSIVAFCQQEGVSEATFHAWKRKLHGPSSTRHSSGEAVTAHRSQKRRVPVSRRRGPQNLVASPAAARHPADFLQLPVRGVRSSPWIELTLIDGTLVRIPQENLTALTTLLRVLRGDGFDALAAELRHA